MRGTFTVERTLTMPRFPFIFDTRLRLGGIPKLLSHAFGWTFSYSSNTRFRWDGLLCQVVHASFLTVSLRLEHALQM